MNTPRSALSPRPFERAGLRLSIYKDFANNPYNEQKIILKATVDGIIAKAPETLWGKVISFIAPELRNNNPLAESERATINHQEIVDDFKSVLSQKYGNTGILNFFSDHYEKEALEKGLSAKIIQRTLKSLEQLKTPTSLGYAIPYASSQKKDTQDISSGKDTPILDTLSSVPGAREEHDARMRKNKRGVVEARRAASAPTLPSETAAENALNPSAKRVPQTVKLVQEKPVQKSQHKKPVQRVKVKF